MSTTLWVCPNDDNLRRISRHVRSSFWNVLSILFLFTPIAVYAEEGHARLDGSVTAAERPVAGADVFVYTARPKSGPSTYCPSCYPDCSKRTKTARDGTFHFDKLADWLKFRVLIVADGYEPTFIDYADPARGDVHAQLTRRSVTDGSEVFSGVVLDASGNPIVGASAYAVGMRMKNGGTMMGNIPGFDPLAITDKTGSFRLYGKPTDKDLAGGKAVIKIEARDHADQLTAPLTAGDSPRTIAMTDGATIAGYITDDTGRPLPGVVVKSTGFRRVADFGDSVNEEIASTTDGKFTFSNMPPGVEYKIFSSMESLRSSALATVPVDIMTDEDGSSTPVVKLVAHRATRITGHVVLKENQPLPADARMMLSRGAVTDAEFAPVQQDGSFSFDGVPMGENVSLALDNRKFRLVANVYTLSGAYLLRSSLDRGIRDFTLVVEPTPH